MSEKKKSPLKKPLSLTPEERRKLPSMNVVAEFTRAFRKMGEAIGAKESKENK